MKKSIWYILYIIAAAAVVFAVIGAPLAAENIAESIKNEVVAVEYP